VCETAFSALAYMKTNCRYRRTSWPVRNIPENSQTVH